MKAAYLRYDAATSTPSRRPHMKRFEAPLLIVAAIFIGFTIASVGGQQAQPAAGGVFTAAQAQAGQAAYAQQCAGCHRRRLSRLGRRACRSQGRTSARSGDRERSTSSSPTSSRRCRRPIRARWAKQGTLEVTAFLLQINGAPAGPAAADGTGRNADQRAARQDRRRRPHPRQVGGAAQGGRGAAPPMVVGAGTAARGPWR